MPTGFVSVKCEFTNVFSSPFLQSASLMIDWMLLDSGLVEEYKDKIVLVQIHEIGRCMEIHFEMSVNCLQVLKQMSGSLFVKCSVVGFHFMEILCKFDPDIDYVEQLVMRENLKIKCGKYGMVLQMLSIPCENPQEEEARIIVLTRLYSNQVPKYIRLDKDDEDDEEEEEVIVHTAATTVQLDLAELDDYVLEEKWQDMFNSMFISD